MSEEKKAAEIKERDLEMPNMPCLPEMPLMNNMMPEDQMQWMNQMPAMAQMPYMNQVPMMCCPILMNMQCPLMYGQGMPGMGQSMGMNPMLPPYMSNPYIAAPNYGMQY